MGIPMAIGPGWGVLKSYKLFLRVVLFEVSLGYCFPKQLKVSNQSVPGGAGKSVCSTQGVEEPVRKVSIAKTQTLK